MERQVSGLRNLRKRVTKFDRLFRGGDLIVGQPGKVCTQFRLNRVSSTHVDLQCTKKRVGASIDAIDYVDRKKLRKECVAVLTQVIDFQMFLTRG
jgi:hypothetical protein